MLKTLIRKVNIGVVLFLTIILTGGVGTSTYVFASAISSFTQQITAGTLAVDITNASYETVENPSVAMTPVGFSFACQNSTGTLGAAEQIIYIVNPDAADNGWTVSLAASNPSGVWDSAGIDFDFNDASGGGCTDGSDSGDTLGGQMTIDASTATLATAGCVSCTTNNISKGSAGSFVEGTSNNVTILTGAAGSDDIGKWKLSGVSVTQKIPAEQPVASDYNLDMTLSIVAF